MFFTDIILKTLFLGVLLSLTGNDHTSETPDHAVVTATAKESGVLDDLIEGVEEQCSSTKSSGTESFVKSCNHFTNETSLQCFLNLKGASNVIVHQNITEKGGEKDPQPSLERKNEKQLRKSLFFSFFRSRDNIFIRKTSLAKLQKFFCEIIGKN